MRLISIAFPLALSICIVNQKSAAQSADLYGVWKPVKEEMGGKVIASSAFETQKLTLADSNYIFVAESVDKGVVRYKENKMDIYGREGINQGKHFTAIYKYENNLLTICYNLLGDTYPKGFETTGKPLLFLCVFKKEGE